MPKKKARLLFFLHLHGPDPCGGVAAFGPGEVPPGGQLPHVAMPACGTCCAPLDQPGTYAEHVPGEHDASACHQHLVVYHRLAGERLGAPPCRAHTLCVIPRPGKRPAYRRGREAAAILVAGDILPCETDGAPLPIPPAPLVADGGQSGFVISGEHR